MVRFPFNYWDPATGFVPATGFQNSPSDQDSPTVTIVERNEFGEADDEFDVSFSPEGFILNADLTDIADQLVAFGPYQITLTDTAFQSAMLVNDTFPGLTHGISGDVITINAPITYVSPYEFSASFDAIL